MEPDHSELIKRCWFLDDQNKPELADKIEDIWNLKGEKQNEYSNNNSITTICFPVNTSS